MRRRVGCLVALVAAVLALPAPAADPPPTVASVNLARYAGKWYEIAKIPNRFQSHCASGTTAEYGRRADGLIDVVNRCVDREGRGDEARGVARVVDARSNAKLEVSFFSLFGWRPVWGDYWVLDLAPGYDYAVVGVPDRRYGWILARTAVLPQASRTTIDERLKALGYDPARFENTVHTPAR
jgi:apolipoprotein D and lipocalin family protein